MINQAEPAKNQQQQSNTQKSTIVPAILNKEWQKRIQNIIYNMYILEKFIDSPKLITAGSKGSHESHQQKKQNGNCSLWQQMRKQFNISLAATINQLYINQKLITHVVHYLTGLPFIQNSKKIIKNIVQYYDPSRTFLKSLIQSLVPVLQNQSKSELNRINVILYTLNTLFMQQSPQNPKFNSYIYLNGGQGIKVQEKVRWPFQKSGTICLWYNMSDQTKQCKFFEINGEKSGFQIVLKNKKIYFEKIKQQRGFSLIRNDSAFLCEAESNTDVKLWIQFQIKKKIFQKALFINVIMNNFVLNNIELDIFTPLPSQYSISLFKNFHGKVSSALIFTHNLTKQVQNLNSKQGFIYQSDIKNFSYMFDNLLSHVFLLYTSIRAKTETIKDQTQQGLCELYQQQQQQHLFDKGSEPTRTIIFDAINRRNGIIGPQACVYRNISIHKKQMVLYGGLHSYLGFFNLLKLHSKYAKQNIQQYTRALGELILLFKNIFESKAGSIEQSQSINLFRIISNFFVETEMIGYTEEITPKLKELYVALNNRIIKQKFIKKLIWGIPAGQFLQLAQLQNYINLVKGFYLEQIQNSLNIYNVKDIINFIIDKYDRTNCCFQHMRTSSIDCRKKIKKYPQVLAQYFKIIQTIIQIKRYDNDVSTIIHQIISCFHYNASPCFIESVVKFLTSLFQKDSAIQSLFIEQFQTINQAKMGLFSALANSYSWKTKASLIKFILHIYGIKMFREGGEKDLMALCIRFPTITARFSSIKSQDFDRSVDFSEDKFSYNSTNVRTIMAMRPLSFEEIVQLNDQQIIKVIWQWGTSARKITDYNLQQNQNPAVLLLTDLYKGSTYKIRKMISNILLSNHQILLFTPDLMAWVIQCLLLCQCDQNSMINSDQILYKAINQTKVNLLKLISTYRISIEGQQQQSVQNQLDIIKLILISVKSKYSSQISKFYHIVFLHISKQVINSFYEEIKATKFQNQEIYEQKIKHIVSNCYRCIFQHFISNGNDDVEFQDQSQMEQNQKQYAILLAIIQKIFQILLYMASPGNNTLMEEANAKRNQIIFQILFSEQGASSQVSLLCFIFVCLQGIFDNYDDHSNIVEKKLALTLIKKYLIFLVEISENSGSLKLQKFQQTLKNIFLNTLGFLESKFYQYYFIEGGIQMAIFKNIEQIKNLIVNIFLQLLQLMKYIQQSSCAKHKSFYQLMKPKKKHKNIFNIKNLFPIIWKKVDDKVIQFISLNVDTLKNEEARNKLQEHLKMKRLYTHTISIEKTISKIIDKLLEQQKKCSQEIQKKSVFSYQNNQAQKCKILTQYEQNIAMFMFQNTNKQSNQSQQRRIQAQAIRRSVKNQQKKIWKINRVYEGLWANQKFYDYSQNMQSLNYNNQISNFYKRVRSERQSKYLLQPFIAIQPNQRQIFDDKSYQQQIFTIDCVQQEGQKSLQQNERRKSDKYLQVGFQFLKKKVIQKIKRTALLSKQKIQQQPGQIKTQSFYFKEILFIQPMKVHSGTLKIDHNWLEFQYRPSSHLQHISLLKNRQNNDDPMICKWPINQIQIYQLKKYMLKPNSIQFYFKDKFSLFFSFYGRSELQFPKFLQIIQKLKRIDYGIDKIPYPLKILDPFKQVDKYLATQMWKNRQMTNFQYLLCLNILSGRTNCDLNQYFIFPWILADYSSSKTRKDQCRYRDLQKNMGSLGSADRIQKFIQIKNTIEQNHKDQFAHSHFFGFHYSNLPIILQYLIRLHPYAQGSMQLQGGKFDIPDRLFVSINDTFRNATTEMSDVRELIPQFYYFPQFLVNAQDFDFGIQQSSKRVNNVQIPDGYSNAYDFIEAHREEFQSQQVSQNIHKWIDLVFGYKQYGKEADVSYNKFHYLSYENHASSIFQQQKSDNRLSMQSQICYFGKVPSQIFTKPHPKRNPISAMSLSQYTEGYTRANPFINQKNLNSSAVEYMIRHQKGIFSFSNQACIHFRYCQANKKYLILRRDGRGILFQNQKSEYNKELAPQRYLFITSPLHFQIVIDKFQFIYIFDQSIKLNKFPICSLWGEHIFIGGLWGGKIIKYDIITKQCEVHCKHSDTVTALVGNEQLAAVVSGTINGQIVIWQYINKTSSSSASFTYPHLPYVHTSRKLIYKNKIVTHYKRINKININADLRVAVCSSDDGLVSMIDIERYEVIRVIKIGIPIKNAVILTYPYYMVFISCAKHQQFCYSLNGQFLDESNFQNLHEEVKICSINGYQERILIKKLNQPYFSMIKLPELREQLKIQIKNDDNQVLQFQVNSNQTDLQILFNTHTHLIHCSKSLVNSPPSKHKSGKKAHSFRLDI